MSNKKRAGGSFGTKGYYIALILCVVAIGISGYLYYRNANQEEPQVQTPTQDQYVDVVSPTEDDIHAVATQPTLPPAGDGTLPTTPQTPVQKPLQTGQPLTGETLMVYAMDSLCYNPTTRDWRVHDGIDIAAEAGTPVCAAAAGTVSATYEDDTMGTTVVITHEGGYITVYSSLDSELAVSVGDHVDLGQTIGQVGNTALLESALGDHLHFSVSCNDLPMDPNLFFGLN
ncbi:MAG: M23 family metallopeptidase [Oscillospiraceae bacterium]|nr:M23 family metallopeptidase [Oscillospiraceae bacterium]